VGERWLPGLLIWGSLAGLVLVSFAGCGGDDGDEENGNADESAATFVGDTQDKDMFVAIVSMPPGGEDEGKTEMVVCDASRFCESLPASLDGGSLEAGSDEGAVRAEGALSDDTITGTIDLPGRKTVRFTAEAATAAAGVYELTVSSEGKVRGTSTAGVALTGESTLPDPGSGALKLADGTRLDFDAEEDPAAEALRLSPGEVRLIVLPDGELRGAGRSATSRDGSGGSYFFFRSSG
jgi:hypothetical protein